MAQAPDSTLSSAGANVAEVAGRTKGTFHGDPQATKGSKGTARPPLAHAKAIWARSPTAKLTAQEIAAIERLATEREVEGRARETLRSSMAQQAAILAELAAGGVAYSTVAHRLSLVNGAPAPASARRRLAKGLCKRVLRALTTSGRHDLGIRCTDPGWRPEGRRRRLVG